MDPALPSLRSPPNKATPVSKVAAPADHCLNNSTIAPWATIWDKIKLVEKVGQQRIKLPLYTVGIQDEWLENGKILPTNGRCKGTFSVYRDQFRWYSFTYHISWQCIDNVRCAS